MIYFTIILFHGGYTLALTDLLQHRSEVGAKHFLLREPFLAIRIFWDISTKRKTLKIVAHNNGPSNLLQKFPQKGCAKIRLESVSVCVSVSIIGWLQKVFCDHPPHIIEIRTVMENLL